MIKSVFVGATNSEIMLGVAAFLVILLLTRQKKAIPRGLRFPPGPRGWPIAGNVTDMPKQQEWITFTRWAKEHGDLVYIKVFGMPLISVSSPAVAHDLFELRSSIYSDRCELPMMKLMGTDWFFGQMPYGDRWRAHRKAFHQHFGPNAIVNYHEIETKHTRILLHRLNDTPEKFIRHIRHLPGATIMEIVYGIRVLPINDPYIEIAEKAMAAAAVAGNPGTFLVDIIPALKYIPEWFPGASFRKKARIWREIIIQVPVMPYEAAKRAVRAGTAAQSVTTSLIEEISDTKEASPDLEERIRNTAGAAYTAGADTTVSALTSFMLAMLLYPSAQRKAQAELDAVIGDRLPEFSDREHLPYMNALCKEVHRWHPVGPLGVAHAVTEDDVYGEYFIPKGCIVVGNAWAMLHDEKTFGPNPEQFNPDRFLEPGVPDPIVAFGFGRRICPGRHLADDSIFMAAASVLKVYSISLATDAKGQEIPVEARFTSGFISHPEPFVCTIKPRSAAAESLLAECPRD